MGVTSQTHLGLNSKYEGSCMMSCHVQSKNCKNMGLRWSSLPDVTPLGIPYACRRWKGCPNANQSFSISTWHAHAQRNHHGRAQKLVGVNVNENYHTLLLPLCHK